MKAKFTLEDGRELEVDVSEEELSEMKIGGERWKPEENELYYSLDSYGNISMEYYRKRVYDKFRYQQRNIFRTAEAAQQYLDYLNALAILRDDAGDFQPDWDNTNQKKYYIFKDQYNYRLFISQSITVQYVNNIFFKTKAAAQNSVDTHEQEWMTVFNYKQG